MISLARFVIAHRWWVLAAWLLLAVAGGYADPEAISALTYDFGLPGQAGYEANQQIMRQFGTGGDNAPILLVVGNGRQPVPAASAVPVVRAAERAAPGARVVSYAAQASLLAADGRTGVVMVYPHPVPGADAYAAALPALQHAASVLRRSGVPVEITGQDALQSGGGGGGSGVLAETLFGGVGALVVLVLVFGSFLALMPLVIAAGSILTTFLIVWGLTGLTSVSFIVQYLLALIGRSALFSGITVAVSLAALIALPVPFLRSVGFTGLLIPVVSVIAALTLLPALLLVAGPKLAWPHRRSADTDDAIRHGVARTGRLITSAAFILFLAFIALSRVPTTDVRILATALALGIIIDATIVRGVLAPALVAALGPANWWAPRWPRNTQLPAPARATGQILRAGARHPVHCPGPSPANSAGSRAFTCQARGKRARHG